MIIAIARLGLYMKLPYLDPQVVPQNSYTASKLPPCLAQNWHAVTCLHFLSLLSGMASVRRWKAADAQQMLPCLVQSKHCITQA